MAEIAGMPVKALVHLVLAALGFSTSKWFNSPGPQRKMVSLMLWVREVTSRI